MRRYSWGQLLPGMMNDVYTYVDIDRHVLYCSCNRMNVLIAIITNFKFSTSAESSRMIKLTVCINYIMR